MRSTHFHWARTGRDAGKTFMSNRPVGRQLEQLSRLAHRTWHHKQGRLLLLASLSFVIFLAFTTSGSHAKAGTSLQDAQRHPKLTATSAAAGAKSVRSRTALSDAAGMGAMHLDSNAQLHGMLANSSRAFQPPGKFAIRREDLLVAIPSDLKHIGLIEASKAWRKDLKTYIAVNTSLLPLARPVSPRDTELWRSYPDYDEAMQKHGCQSWEPRMVLTPFFAHEAFEGDYDWMLYGHDDTFFFVEGVLDLLQDFDPSLPYVITDHFWWSDEPIESATNFFHPHEFAPHCLPCHWSSEDEQRSTQAVDSYKPFAPYIGCPCTVEEICRHDNRKLYTQACDEPLNPLPFRMDAGAGALISRGLMEKIPLSFMEKCVLDIKRAQGADDLFSRCLQQAGYAFTSPGHSFYHWEAKSFDPGPQHSQLLEKIFHDASSGAAQDIPLGMISHVITSHVKLEGQSPEGAAGSMLKLQKAYEAWQAALLATQQPMSI